MSKSRVALVIDKGVFHRDGKLREEKVKKLLAEALKSFALGRRSAGSSGKAHLEPLDARFARGDTVTIKLNCLAGRMMSSQPALSFALAGFLRDVGVKPKNIILWERTTAELKRAGYTGSDGSCRLMATDSRGVDYTRDHRTSGEVASLVSRIQADFADKSINLPVLKDHNLAGLSGGMKNYYGAIHNPNKYHDNGCTPFVADVNSLPEIKAKNKLTIVDCLRVQLQGGPAYKARFAVEFGGVLIGDDPVAVDKIAWRLLDELRVAKGLKPLAGEKREPKYLAVAADDLHRLGNEDDSEIEFVRKEIVR